MTATNEINRKVMAEFRANGGIVPSRVHPSPLLILHTIGAKTGQPRENPLAYLPDDDSFAIFGTNAARPSNPDWYHNLRAHPKAVIEVGSERIPVAARVVDGEEKHRLWSAQVAVMPLFAEYEQKVSRAIPVIVLERYT
jgi:deazaflavin-dependent oxidoreductase (nitroreductase family)